MHPEFKDIVRVNSGLEPRGRNSIVLGADPSADTLHVQGMVFNQLSRSDPQGTNRRVVVLDVGRTYQRYSSLLELNMKVIEYIEGELPEFNKPLVVVELEELKTKGMDAVGGLDKFKSILKSRLSATDLLVINEAWCIDPDFVMWAMSNLDNEVVVTAMLESDLEKRGYDTSLFNGSAIRVIDLKI